MDQRLRLMTAAAVMLFGLGLALFFRRPAAEADLPIPVPSDPLVLRKQPDPRTFAVAESVVRRVTVASRSRPSRRSRGACRPRSSRRPISRPRRRNCPRLPQRRPTGQYAMGDVVERNAAGNGLRAADA